MEKQQWDICSIAEYWRQRVNYGNVTNLAFSGLFGSKICYAFDWPKLVSRLV